EGRNYTGMMRHQVLCLLLTTFAAEHAQRLRGGKSGGDDGAGEPGHEPTLRGVAPGASGDDPAGVAGCGQWLPPTPPCPPPPAAAHNKPRARPPPRPPPPPREQRTTS